MKLTVKTITGTQFAVEATLEDTVLQVKSKIEAQQGYKTDLQKLIHAGKVLKDEQTLKDLNVKETDFFVCMVSKPKAGAAKPATPAPAPAPAPAPTPSAAPAPTPAAAPAAPRPGSPRRTTPSASSAAPSTSTPSTTATGVGAADPAIVRQLADMGFPEDQVRAALAAAFNNPDRAVEYLMNGIPETSRSAPAPSANRGSAPAGDASALEELRRHPQIDSLRQLVQSNPAALPAVLQQIGQRDPELLQLIHRHQEEFVRMLNEPIGSTATPSSTGPTQPGSGAPPAAGLPGDAGMDPQQLLTMIQGMPPEQRTQMAAALGMTPEQLQQITQMMATMPPEVMQQMLGSLAGGGGGGGLGGPTPVTIQLTQEESEAINRLAELGFDRSEALQAYLACDKNEALAANFLMDSMADWDAAPAPGGQGGAGGGGNAGNDDDMYG